MSEKKIMRIRIIDNTIIPKILLCLPGKSLVRFKCVSIHWLSLITSPLFVKSYLSRSRSHPSGKLVIAHGKPVGLSMPYRMNPRLFLINLEEKPVYRVTFHDPVPTFICDATSNVVDGLICFNVYVGIPYFWVYNITTREILPLPCPPVREGVACMSVTLCFDSIRNVYKLVYMHWPTLNRTRDVLGCEVLTILGGNVDEYLWRSITIDILTHIDVVPGSGTGFYHDGIIYPFRDTIEKVMTVFNVAREKFENIDFPTEYDGKKKVTTCLVGGCVSIVVIPTYNPSVFPGNKFEINLWRRMGPFSTWTQEVIKCPFCNYLSELISCSEFGLMSLVTNNDESELGLVTIECYDLTTRENKLLQLFNVEGFLGTPRKLTKAFHETYNLVENIMGLKNYDIRDV